MHGNLRFKITYTYIKYNHLFEMDVGRLYRVVFCVVALTYLVEGQLCPKGCEGCRCDTVFTDGIPTFTVTCEAYNRTVIPACLNESTSALLIYGSNISTLREGVFQNATGITIIEITTSPLDQVDAKTFHNLTTLKDLSLRNNHIVQIEDGLFSGSPNLTSVDLSGNRISQITANSLSNLAQLRILDLSRNAIGEIEDNSFTGNINLERINMEGNSIDLIYGGTFAGLTSMLFLNVSHNNIDAVQTGAFPDSQSLGVLDLSSNTIGSDAFPPDIFENKVNLKELYLRRNSFETVPVDSLSEAASLEILDFQGCLLASIPNSAFSTLVNLKTLILKNQNPLSSVEVGAFSGLQALVELDLSDNPGLTTIPPAALPDDDLASLKILRLNNNSLTTIDEDMFINKVSLETVEIQGNHLFCSCRVSWIRIFMDDDKYPWIEQWKSGPTAVVCQTPSHFEGTAVYNVTSSDLTCQLAVVLGSNEIIGHDITYQV